MRSFPDGWCDRRFTTVDPVRLTTAVCRWSILIKNFALGLIIGMAFAVGGYKPYQIEMEYRRNIAAGLGTPGLPVVCITGLQRRPSS